MKKSVFLFYLFITAVLFNLKMFQTDIWSRLESDNFLPLCLVMMGVFWGYATWITTQYHNIANKQCELTSLQGAASLVKRPISRYLFHATAPIFLFHIFAIWCIASIAENTADIFGNYMVNYIPILFILVVGYSFVLLFRPEYALANSFRRGGPIEEPKDGTPITSLDVPIHLYSVFYHLLKGGGMGPIMKDMATRFFDIVFIETYSKERYVILSNGERMLSDNILDELRKRGLDRWVIKISKNYYINMLHVFYPIETRPKKLELQPEVYENMQKKLTPATIRKMTTIGPGMKNNPVKDFLVNTNSMDHKGWDDFIPLR